MTGLKKRWIALAMVIGIVTLTSCATKVKADITGYSHVPITVVGLEEESFTVTPDDLTQMKCTSKTAEGKSEKAGTVKAVGPTLETFVKSYGKDLNQYKFICFHGSDGYRTVLDSKVFTEKEVILSVANGDKPLEQWQQPLRIVIPEGDSGQWTRLVEKIEFVEK